MTTTLETLQHRWHTKTGEQMPEAIARLPIERVTAAVELTESGCTVVVPVEQTEARDGIGYGDSMREWDSDSFY